MTPRGPNVGRICVRWRKRPIVVVVQGGESPRGFGSAPVVGQAPQSHPRHVKSGNLIRLDVMRPEPKARRTTHAARPSTVRWRVDGDAGRDEYCRVSPPVSRLAATG